MSLPEVLGGRRIAIGIDIYRKETGYSPPPKGAVLVIGQQYRRNLKGIIREI